MADKPSGHRVGRFPGPVTGKGKGMDNSAMNAGRYYRWAGYRRKLAWIKEHLASGRTVYLSTRLRRVKLTAKDIDMVKATRDGLFVRSGKSWLCHTYSDLAAV